MEIEPQLDKEKELIKTIMENPVVFEALKLSNKMNLPNWYIGAGCITQSVWNRLHNYPIGQNILDIDLIFYDPNNMGDEYEKEIKRELNSSLNGISLMVDVVNEARVHLWYEEHFGIKIDQYTSSEDAIKTWPSTATSIGINFKNEKFKIFAPFGLEDLFNLIVRPNKRLITREVYEKKVARWRLHWPKLQIVNWDE